MSRDSATRPKRRPARRLAACALAVLGLVGLGTGSASQFPLAGAAVSAGSAMIAPCQGSAPIGAVFTTTYDTGDHRYEATAVQLTGINDACDTRYYTLAVVRTTGSRGPWTGFVSGGATDSHTFTATAVTEIVRVEVVIS